MLAVILSLSNKIQAEDPTAKTADIVFVVDTGFGQNGQEAWLIGKTDESGNIVQHSIMRQIHDRLASLDICARYGLVMFDKDSVAYSYFGDLPSPISQPTSDGLWVSGKDLHKMENVLTNQWESKKYPANSNGKDGLAAVMRVLGMDPGPENDDDDGGDNGNGNGDPGFAFSMGDQGDNSLFFANLFCTTSPTSYLSASAAAPINTLKSLNYGLEPPYEFLGGSKNIVFISSFDNDLQLEHEDHQQQIFDICDSLDAKEVTFHSITKSLFGGNFFKKPNNIGSNNKFRFEYNGGDPTPWAEQEEYVEVFRSISSADDNLAYVDLKSYREELTTNGLYPNGNSQIIERNWSIETKFMIKDDGSVGEKNARIYFGRINDYSQTNKNDIKNLAFLEISATDLEEGPSEQDWLFGPEETGTGRPVFSPFVSSANVVLPIINTNTWYGVELRAIDSHENIDYRRFDLIVKKDGEPILIASSTNKLPQADNMQYIGIGSFKSNTAFDYFKYSYRPESDLPGEIFSRDILPSAETPTPYDFEKTNIPFSRLFHNDFGSVDGSSYGTNVFGIKWNEDNSPIAYFDSPGSGFQESDNGLHVRCNDEKTSFQDVNYVQLAEKSAGSAWSILPILAPIGSDSEPAINSFTEAFLSSTTEQIEANSGISASSVEIGDLVNGIAAGDYAGGKGFLMYSEEDVSTRFQGPNAPFWSTSKHVIAVRHVPEGIDNYQINAPAFGIGVDDNASDTGGEAYIMYSAENLQERFVSNPPFYQNSAQLIAVRHIGNDVWQYNDNTAVWHPFEPITEETDRTLNDRLIARIWFDVPTEHKIEMLDGNIGFTHGIASGYHRTNIEIFADRWQRHDRFNPGEFFVRGSYFEVENSDSPARWQYNDNYFWHDFVPSPATNSDRLLAIIDFDAPLGEKVCPLACEFGSFGGIKKGFLRSELLFHGDSWGGGIIGSFPRYNLGEFEVEDTNGTTFTIADDN